LDDAAAADFGGGVWGAVGVLEVGCPAGRCAPAFERGWDWVDYGDAPQTSTARVPEDCSVSDSQGQRTTQQNPTVGVTERAEVHRLGHGADMQHQPSAPARSLA
jgi:hypothetical protein